MQMKSSMSSVVTFLLFHLLSIATINNISLLCNGSSYNGVCMANEREALLKFKADLKDPSERLATWTKDSDCCTWAGVICNNFTGHVLELHLRNPKFNDYFLSGKINPSLLAIKNLIYLDLSFNDFEGIQIPRFLGSMRNLRYLDLSKTGFVGSVPPQLGNLSNLQYLDLSQDLDQIFIGRLYVHNLNWVSGLTLLEHLDLTGVNLSKASNDWLLPINKLPRLTTLNLSSCELHQFPAISSANFSSLVTLALRDNNFVKSSNISGLSELVFLDLSYNNFQGPIPAELQNLTSLEHLDLSFNNFNSSIPNWLYRFSRLQYLSLSYNSLQGKILGDIGNLTRLEKLRLSYNYDLQGKIPSSFERLCNLKSIDLYGVNLSQDVSKISNIFSRCISVGLEILVLHSTQLFGHLTDQFIGTLKNVEILNLDNNNISGPIPMSLGGLSSLRYLKLSNNKLNGTLSEIHFTNLTSLEVLAVSESPSLTLKVSPDWIPPFQLSGLYLGSCQIGPRFPLWLSSQFFLQVIDISNSGINDKIPTWFSESFPMLTRLNLSYNQIGGALVELE